MNTIDIIDSNIDPWAVLGLSREAGDQEIEKAWKEKQSSYQNREHLNLAYKLIATEEDRSRFLLLSPGIPESLNGILDQMPMRTRFSGSGIWYSSLKNILKDQDKE